MSDYNFVTERKLVQGGEEIEFSGVYWYGDLGEVGCPGWWAYTKGGVVGVNGTSKLIHEKEVQWSRMRRFTMFDSQGCWRVSPGECRVHVPLWEWTDWPVNGNEAKQYDVGLNEQIYTSAVEETLQAVRRFVELNRHLVLGKFTASSVELVKVANPQSGSAEACLSFRVE